MERGNSIVRNRPLKTVVLGGGLLLALYALGRLWMRDRGVPAGHSPMPQQPIPPCTFKYKEFTYNLN
jgi:hypothetical protein